MIHGDAEINMTGFDPRRFGDFADRHYMREKGFQDYGLTYATPVPGEEFSAARDCRLSPLHAALAEKGAVFTQTFGWERPQWFSLDGREEECSYRRNNVFDVVRAECEAVRDRVGVIDMTGFAKYDVRGAGAEAFLNRLLANRMPKRDGGMALAHFLSRQGRILGEATVTRIANDHFYLLSAASAELRDLDHLLQQREEGEAVEEVGPGKHFLGSAHTLSNFETAFYRSTVADNNSYEQWSAEGSLDSAQRANILWKKMLAEYEAPALDPAIDEALQAFMTTQKASFADRDY